MASDKERRQSWLSFSSANPSTKLLSDAETQIHAHSGGRSSMTYNTHKGHSQPEGQILLYMSHVETEP